MTRHVTLLLRLIRLILIIDKKSGAAHVEVQRRQYDVVKPLEDLTFKYLLEKE